MPDISVIVPVFNSAAYLQECLESILTQTFQSFEVILVDDASTDASWTILSDISRKDSRFSAYRLEQNCGAGPARNFGIKKATGKYCLFCDADDAYPPYAFQVLFEHAEKHQADVACGNIAPMDSALRCYKPLDGIHLALSIKEEALVRELDHPSLWWPLYHPKFLIATSLLAEKDIRYPDFRRGQDPVFLARVLCAAERIAILPHTVYHYRILEKAKIRDTQTWLSYLGHCSDILDIFLDAGRVQCACLFYVLSIPAWHNFSMWRMLSAVERAEERAKFTAYAEKIRPYSPWAREYYPYPIELDDLRKQETFYLKHGHGLSCLRMAWSCIWRKISSSFARLKNI